MQSYVRDALRCCYLFSSCLPTQVSVHLLWCACTSEEYIVCVYTVQLVQKLQEQTDRSSLHSGARGKPLIKQRDRNWPSWWYNLYTWNTQSAHPHTICTNTHTHLYLHTLIRPQKMHTWTLANSKCTHIHTCTDQIYTDESLSADERQLVSEHGNTLT